MREFWIRIAAPNIADIAPVFIGEDGRAAFSDGPCAVFDALFELGEGMSDDEFSRYVDEVFAVILRAAEELAEKPMGSFARTAESNGFSFTLESYAGDCYGAPV